MCLGNLVGDPLRGLKGCALSPGLSVLLIGERGQTSCGALLEMRLLLRALDLV